MRFTGVRGGSTIPNLFEPLCNIKNKACGEVHKSSGWFKAMEPFSVTQRFKKVRKHEQDYTAIPHEFEVVQRIRTFLNHCVTLKTRLVGEVHMSSGWFNLSEPFRATV